MQSISLRASLVGYLLDSVSVFPSSPGLYDASRASLLFRTAHNTRLLFSTPLVDCCRRWELPGCRATGSLASVKQSALPSSALDRDWASAVSRRDDTRSVACVSRAHARPMVLPHLGWRIQHSLLLAHCDATCSVS